MNTGMIESPPLMMPKTQKPEIKESNNLLLNMLITELSAYSSQGT